MDSELIKEDFDLNIEDYSLRIRTLKFNDNNEDPSIIFLHDSLGCITLWRDFPEKIALATGYNTLIYDRQGYGKSSPFSSKRELDYLEKEADILYMILEKCKINQVILFGHSDGGSISIIAAAKYPEKIKAVITEGAHVFVDNLTLQGVQAAKDSYTVTNIREKLTKYHGEKTDDVFKYWTETWLSPEFNTKWNIEGYLPLIKCPVLAIQGESDEFGTMQQIESIAKNVSGKSQMEIIPSSGHNPHKENTELTLKIIKEFIKKII